MAPFTNRPTPDDCIGRISDAMNEVELIQGMLDATPVGRNYTADWNAKRKNAQDHLSEACGSLGAAMDVLVPSRPYWPTRGERADAIAETQRQHLAALQAEVKRLESTVALAEARATAAEAFVAQHAKPQPQEGEEVARRVRQAFPIDPNETGRFVQGVDRTDFRSLGCRLIPCSRFHSPHAVDLAWRVWWWSAKTSYNRGTEHEGTDCWYLLDDDNGEQVLREMEQWKRAAPLALEVWRELLTESSAERRVLLLTRIVDMQNVLLAAWGAEPWAPVLWRLGFFYRTITLDGRWLLTEHEVPPFDVSLFGQLLRPKVPLSGEARDLLMDDPVTRGMSELYQDTPTNTSSEVAGRLRVIDGGLGS